MRTRLAQFSSLLLLLAGTVFLSGCIGFGGAGSEPTRFYVLRFDEATAPGGLDFQGLAVGIRRVEVPEYLSIARIAVARGEAQVEYSDFHRWAEGLDLGVGRLLYAHLEQLGADAELVPYMRRERLVAEVSVSIVRFEATTEGVVLLEANWGISIPGGDLLGTGTTRASEPATWTSSDYSEMVTAMSTVTHQLGADIAAELAQLQDSGTLRAE